MFSDGITEAENGSGEDFGEARLLASVCNNWHADTRDLCDAVLCHVRSFLGDLDPQDDQTLIIIRPQPSRADSMYDEVFAMRPLASSVPRELGVDLSVATRDLHSLA
jgi:hypothetical protein